MRVVTLEEHVSFAGITNRIDKDAIARRGFVPGMSRPGTNPQPQLEDVGEGRLKSMDESGVTVQVLSVSGPGADLLEGDDSIALARDYNDAIFEKVRAHPTRFAAFAHLPITAPQAAADELERAVEELGFCGALINGATNGRFLDDKQFGPILARAEELAVPLYLHPAIPLQAVRDVYYSGMSPMADRLLAMAGFGWHAETAIQVLRLIVSGRPLSEAPDHYRTHGRDAADDDGTVRRGLCSGARGYTPHSAADAARSSQHYNEWHVYLAAADGRYRHLWHRSRDVFDRLSIQQQRDRQKVSRQPPVCAG
jgi:hypothetical protein